MDLLGTGGNANVSIYTDGSKTDNHVGASMVAVRDSTEIHIETKTKYYMHGLSNRTLRHNHGSRMDPTPQAEIPLICDKRRL